VVQLSEEKENEEEKQEAPEAAEEEKGATGQAAGESRRQTSSRLWTPQGEKMAGEEERAEEPAGGEESDEELRKRMEEALEKITTADVVVDMMVTLASFAYQRMGIPKDVNEKFRDMDQARLAIDCLDALLSVLTDRVPGDKLDALTGTIDNLKLNFVKES